MKKQTYDRWFYDLIRDGVQSSASVVVPLVIDHLAPETVIDVGCGEGWWAYEFGKHGCDVQGIDGSYVATSPLKDRFTAVNLDNPLPNLGEFDLAVSLEVAEHLPPARAPGFINDLCILAPTVLFSAAIPGQGGVNHVNEQPPGYWVDLFQRNGYQVSGALRWEIWTNDMVENWYRQNILVATRHPEQFPRLFRDAWAAYPHYVIHPVLWDAKRRGR